MLEKEDLRNKLKDGNLKDIKAYLREHIHQYGMMYDMNELMVRVTNEKFNPKYYVQYLKEKFE